MEKAPPPIIITTNEELGHFCALLAGEEFITIDTEFIREKTYYPQLCLVQIATSQDVVLIDPLVSGLNMAPLWQSLQRPDLVKVLHSGRQDMEIILQATQMVPPNLFDTQVAVQFLGIEETIGYEALVRIYLDRKLDKTAQRSNWLRRPLSKQQIDYAALDVFYLREIYTLLRQGLLDKNRLEWFQEEMQLLYDLQAFQPNYVRLFKQLGFIDKDFGSEALRKVFSLLRAREQLAQELNLPRQGVMDIETFKAVLRKDDQDIDSWRAACPHLTQGDIGRLHQYYRQQIQDVVPCPKEMLEATAVRDDTLAYMQLCLKTLASQHELAPSLLVSVSNLASFIHGAGDTKHHPLNQGWRYEIAGKKLKEILSGQVTLGLNRQKGLEFKPV